MIVQSTCSYKPSQFRSCLKSHGFDAATHWGVTDALNVAHSSCFAHNQLPNLALDKILTSHAVRTDETIEFRKKNANFLKKQLGKPLEKNRQCAQQKYLEKPLSKIVCSSHAYCRLDDNRYFLKIINKLASFEQNTHCAALKKAGYERWWGVDIGLESCCFQGFRNKTYK